MPLKSLEYDDEMGLYFPLTIFKINAPWLFDSNGCFKVQSSYNTQPKDHISLL